MSGKKIAQENASKDDPASDLEFLLEDTYPELDFLFSPYHIDITPESDFIVAIDTNVLLVPYSLKPTDLTAISTLYRQLAKAKRLYLPARAAREFIRLRDHKLAEMIGSLNTRLSTMGTPDAMISPLLEGTEGYDKLPDLADKAKGAIKDYRDAVRKLIDKIKSWRGNDPVSLLYDEIFKKSEIISPNDNQAKLSEDWQRRSAARIPPGFNDSGKPDGGIGDFLIWASLLDLGRAQKKDLIFLTYDDKNDWSVQASNQAVYPRPELVDEYRRASGGCNLHISHLSEFLGKMKVERDVVEKVKAVEHVSDSAISASQSSWLSKSTLAHWKTKSNSKFVSFRLSKTASSKDVVGNQPAPIALLPNVLEMMVLAHWSSAQLFLTAWGNVFGLTLLGPAKLNGLFAIKNTSFSSQIAVREGEIFACDLGEHVVVSQMRSIEPQGELVAIELASMAVPRNSILQIGSSSTAFD